MRFSRAVAPVLAVAAAAALSVASGGAFARGGTVAQVPAGGPVPTGFAGSSLSFISGDDGWVLGTAPCRDAPCTSLLRTTNGGASWQGIPAPRARLDSAGASANVSSVRFANADDGFAFDPGLWTTTNGGATWTQTRSVGELRRFTVESLAATRNGTVYLLAGAGAPDTSAGSAMTVFRAPAGSTRFSRVAEVRPAHGLADVVAAGTSVYASDGVDLLSLGPVG